MGRKVTGEIRRLSDGTWAARVRLGTARPFLQMPRVRSEAEARTRGAELATMAQRLHRADANLEGARKMLEEARKAREGADLESIRAAVDLICRGETEEIARTAIPTFKAFALTWTSGELARDFPAHVRAKDSTRDEQNLKNYIGPVLNEMRIDEITLDDAERVMAKIPADRAPGTRKAVAQTLRKILSLAKYPGRYIETDPIPKEWMPKAYASARRAKAMLYPAEEAKLLACTEVPFLRRLAYGILCREGLRASELAELRWGSVDLERGALRLDVNKTDDPRAWALSPDVRAALTAWRAELTAKAEDGKAPPDTARVLEGLDVSRLAEELRADLDLAGVKRAELFERTPARMPIRAHDLRGVFVTTALANGRTETYVRDRTGHRSSQMIATYTRGARTWGELGLGTLAALDATLPELAAIDHGIAHQIAPPARIERAANALGKRCSIH